MVGAGEAFGDAIGDAIGEAFGEAIGDAIGVAAGVAIGVAAGVAAGVDVVVFVLFVFSLPQPIPKAARASKVSRAKVLRIELSPVTQRVRLLGSWIGSASRCIDIDAPSSARSSV